MNRTYFKATRPDGTDFHTGKVHWLPDDGAPIPEGGWLVEHPHPGEVGIWDAAFYLSASTVETDCTGFQWPARLLLVEPVGAVWTPHPDSFPHKRAAHAWRVVEELPAWRLFGPQGREVAAIIDRAEHLTGAQIEDLTAAWSAAQYPARVAALDAALGAARDAARDVARVAARGAARHAAWDVTWVAVLGATYGAAYGAAQDSALSTAHGARDVVLGWLVKDLISDEHFRTLTGPWEQVMGPIEVAA